MLFGTLFFLTTGLISKALACSSSGLAITPQPVDFGLVHINEKSTLTLHVKNRHHHKVISTISSFQSFLRDPFSFPGGKFPGNGGTCGPDARLMPGESCTAKVQFLPSKIGSFSESLVVSYRLKNKEKTACTVLSGRADESPAQLTVVEGGSYNYFKRPLGNTIRREFTLKNIGQKTANSIKVSKAPTSPFSFDGGIFPGNNGTCTSNGKLKEGESCTFVIAFSPTSESSFSSSLEFTYSGPNDLVKLALSGEGQQNQVAGTLDGSYGTTNNSIATANPGGSSGVATTLALTGDDNLVAGGFSYNNTNDFIIAKYLPNGQLDTQFNGTGMRVIDFNGQQDTVNQVLTDTSGATTLVGSSGGSFAFARVLSNGELDSTFGSTGQKTFNLNGGSIDFSQGALLDKDQKIVTVGSSFSGQRYSLAVLRLNANGDPDNTFDNDGVVLKDFGQGNTFGFSLKEQTDRKLVVVGTAFGNKSYDFLISRFQADGSLDSTFNNGAGYNLIDFGGAIDNATDLWIDADGSVFVAGRVLDIRGDKIAMGAAKLRSDGTLDTSFGLNGKYLSTAISGNSGMASLRPTPVGDLLIAWYGHREGRDSYVQLTRLQMNGAIVPTFGTSGTMQTNIRAIPGQKPGLAIQGDGKVLIGGSQVTSGQGILAIQRIW